MKDERDNKIVPFPVKLLTGALFLTGVVLVAMGGSLSVHRDGVGRGAAFTLELPLVSSKVAHG